MKKTKLVLLALILTISLSACEPLSENINTERDIAAEISDTVNTQAVVEVVPMPTPFDAINLDEIRVVAENLGDEEIITVDIRTQAEIETGTLLKDVVKLDFYADSFKDDLAKLDMQKTYLLYCETGSRTGDAKDMMKELGFKNVYDLKGGIVEWDRDLYIELDREEVLADFIGKPSVIVLAGTFCPHCRTAMPAFENEIWDVYKDDVNVFVNVTDGGTFPEERIAQGVNRDLTFDLLTGEECGYVPSFVVLDKNGEVAIKSCGTEKDIEDIKTTIKELL